MSDINIRVTGKAGRITLTRGKALNALSYDMCMAIDAALRQWVSDDAVKLVVIDAEGEKAFCAGGDIKDMAKSSAADVTEDCDPVAAYNREFGHMLHQVNQAPQAVIVLLEGAILGGGFGLACVSDIAIAQADCQFGLPETGLGIPPAQIAPFVVQRLGLTQARRLGVTGARFNGEEALALGLIHEVASNPDEISALLERELNKIRRCAPTANATTKEIMLNLYGDELSPSLDKAAVMFAEAVRGTESKEGMTAFLEKRAPNWTA